MNPVPVKKMTVEFHPLDAENRREGDIIAILGADNHPPRFGTFAAYIPKANEYCRAYVMEEGAGTPIPCSAEGRSITATSPDVFWVPQITIAEPARPTEGSESRSYLGNSYGELVPAVSIGDLFMVEPHRGPRPEGTAEQWRRTLQDMERRREHIEPGIAVYFGNECSALISGILGGPSCAVPYRDVDAWITRARATIDRVTKIDHNTPTPQSQCNLPYGELVPSGALADWLVIEPHQDGQPEGTAAEWWAIIEAMEKGSNLAFKRCGVRFYGDGNAILYSPRNSREGSASACVPNAHREAWTTHARETLRQYEAAKSR